MQTHTGEKPYEYLNVYVCEFIAFSVERTLKTHCMTTYYCREKPYQCKECETSFAIEKSSEKAHENTNWNVL